MIKNQLAVPLCCCFFLILFCTHPARSKVDDGLHGAPGYKLRSSESEEVEQTEVQDADAMTAICLLPEPYCHPVESGDAIPYPVFLAPTEDEYTVFQIEADWLPPDPGTAGKQTIEGIDSDNDCVRDDIERYIAELLSTADQKKARKYLFRYALYRGRFLTENLPVACAKDIARDLYRAAECVRQTINDDALSRDVLDQVFARFHNTFPRSYRYIDNNAKLGGWTTREQITVSCP